MMNLSFVYAKFVQKGELLLQTGSRRQNSCDVAYGARRRIQRIAIHTTLAVSSINMETFVDVSLFSRFFLAKRTGQHSNLVALASPPNLLSDDRTE